MDNQYTVFTRKWRPQTFDDIIGQEQVVLSLKRAIELNRIMHAYLFSGPRGVGKTTTARVFAKALNCEKGPIVTPCNQCTNCNEIRDGVSLDVIEIDGASNRGIEKIRELREHVGYVAARAKYKIYIIDEVHMLTTEAFNALLKTLEEPPKHVIFIFATTNPQALPQTILSRCQHFKFRRMPVGTTVANLQMIAKNEKVEYEEQALYTIARASDGALRDAQRIFDQAITYAGGKKITEAMASEMLGEIEIDLVNNIVEAVVLGNIKNAFGFVEKVIESDYDLKNFMKVFIETLRNLLLIKTIDTKDILTLGEEEYKYLKNLSAGLDKKQILYMLQKSFETEQLISKSFMPDIALESFIIDIVMNNGQRTADEAPLPALAQKPPEKNPAAAKKADAPAEEKPAVIGGAPILIDEIQEEAKILQMTKDIIEKRWENIVDRTRGKGEGEDFVSALETAVIAAYEEPTLFLVGENNLSAEFMKKNTEKIKAVLKQEFKKDIKVIVYEKEEYQNRYKLKKEVTEEDAKNNPMIKKLSKLFDVSSVEIRKTK